MITIEKKLDLFTKMVLEKAKKEYEQQVSDLERSNSKIVAAYKENIEAHKEKIIDQMTKKGQLEKTRIISKANLEYKQRILAVKQELLAQTIANVKAQALAYTDQEGYGALLESLLFKGLENFSSGEAVKIYMTKKDIANHKNILMQKILGKGYEKANISFEAADDEIMGGAVFVRSDNRFKIDYSISALIESERNAIGKNLFDVLKKAGVGIE